MSVGPSRAPLVLLLLTATVVVGSVIRLPAAVPVAPAPRANEYSVKAALIYNIAKFVTWPPAAFATPTAPFTVCVLGADPFGSTLDSAVNGRLVAGRPIAARRVAEPEPGCHVLFVSSSEYKRLGVIIDRIPRPSTVLTVGDADGFNRAGGIIEFFMDGESIHFHVNTSEQGLLQLSARLLQLEPRGHHHGATQ